MFLVKDWPQAIVHIDGDAFFASVYQVTHPASKGKPVVVGKERGLATAVSYEAKRLGIERGTPIAKIKKDFPQVIVVESDYDTYLLFSLRIYQIIKKYSSMVERYSIDEFFVDIKGLRRFLNKSYWQIALSIKKEIETQTGLSVSVGLSVNKSLAKLASSFNKPSGFTIVDGLSIDNFLKKIPIGKVWGIGEQTESLLKKLGIKTAYDFAIKNEIFVKKYLTKPFFEIWQELQGRKIFELNIEEKNSYFSIVRSGSFLPTNNKDFIFSRLISHIDEAFFQARKVGYTVGELTIFIKTKNFIYFKEKIKIKPKIEYPYLIHQLIKKTFNLIFKEKYQYRACGCLISDFEEKTIKQESLFSDFKKEAKAKKIYPLIEAKKVDFATILYQKEKPIFFNRKKFKIPFINLGNFS